LFSETPFPCKYFPKRQQVKQVIRELASTLKKQHPRSRIGFSINEMVNEKKGIHSNSGYVIGNGIYSVYPKRILSSDLVYVEEFEAKKKASKLKQRWRRRGTKRMKKSAFPESRFNRGKHTTEYRVCADATIDRPANNNIAVVSASHLSPKYIRQLAQTRKLVVVNDWVSLGQRISIGKEVDDLIDIKQRYSNPTDLKRLKEKLKKEKVRLHLVEEK